MMARNKIHFFVKKTCARKEAAKANMEICRVRINSGFADIFPLSARKIFRKGLW